MQRVLASLHSAPDVTDVEISAGGASARVGRVLCVQLAGCLGWLAGWLAGYDVFPLLFSPTYSGRPASQACQQGGT